MKSEPLREFRFTDRSIEQKYISEFVEDENSEFETPNLLWIRGQHNIGLSRLLYETACRYEHDNRIFVVRVIAKENSSDDEIISEFLSALKTSSFKETVKLVGLIPRYGAKIVFDAVSDVPSIEFICAKAVLSAGTLLTETNNEIAPYQIAKERIRDYALRTGKRVLVIVDNISNLHKQTIEFLFNIATALYCCDEFRMIIGSHNEDESKPFLERLATFFGVRPITVLEFCDSRYFYALLSDYFSGLQPSDQVIHQIYEKCNHSVGCLRDNLRHYYFSVRQSRDMDINDFAISIRSGESCVPATPFASAYLAVLQTLKAVVSRFHLDNMVSVYIETEMHLHIKNDPVFKLKMISDFDSLVQSGAISAEGQFVALSFTESARSFPCETTTCALRAYDYLIQLDKNEQASVFKYGDFDGVLARLAWDTRASNRLSINIAYANQVIDSGYPHQYMEVISRIALSECDLTGFCDDILRFAQVSYESGDYLTARKLLTKPEVICEMEQQYAFELLLGKVYNVLGDLENAKCHLTRAKTIAHESDDLVTATNMLQLTHQELPGGKEEARRLFEENIDRILSKDEWSFADCMVIRTSVDFWDGGDETLQMIIKATNRAEQAGDYWCEACLRVACGLQFLRASENGFAQNELKKAGERLSVIRPHEQAYVKNDIGLCLMIQGDYTNALDYFREARLWGVNSYIKTNILSNAMVCYALLGRNREALKQVQEFEEIVLRANNSLVTAKLCMQVAYVLLITGSTHGSLQRFAMLFDKCINLACIQGLSPRNCVRVAKYRRCRGMIEEDARLELSNQSHTYNEVDFSPWYSTLHHD